MHDPKFEKDVQQKMEELVFTPPASVWLNVEKEVNKEKKRRFLPFWFFFLPAALLVGAGAIYFSHSTASRKSSIKVESNPGNSLIVNPQASAGHTPSDRPVTAVEPNAQPSAQPGAQSTQPPASQPFASQSTQPSASKSAQPAQPSASQPSVSPLPTGNLSGSHLAGSHTASRSKTSKPNENNTITDQQQSFTATGDPIPGNAGPVPGPAGLAPMARPFVHRSVNPQRSPIDRQAAPITASALPSPVKKPAAGKILLPKPARPWTAGFAAGVGISSLNQGLLDKSSVTSAAYTNYASAITGAPQTYVSNAQPDLSFWAGVLLQKNLRKDLSLSLGLNLHYYSSTIKTGKMVNYDANGLQSSPSTNPANSFVLGNTGLAAAGRAYPYYSPGNNETYTNRYYFLELPASISWQVGHSKTMPLFWEGGLSLSYLVSSNSLYYNAKSGVFFKDGSVVPRTQANLFTGLMVGLPFHGLRIQAGPQIQYGFTNLLNSEGAGNQHLLYGGIKLVFLPGKWKK